MQKIISFNPKIDYDIIYMTAPADRNNTTQLEMMRNEINTRIFDLEEPLKNLLNKYGNIINLFPENESVLNLEIEFFMNKTDVKENQVHFTSYTNYYPTFYVQVEIAQDENEQLKQLEYELSEIIANLTKTLEVFALKYKSVLHIFPDVGPTIKLNIHLVNPKLSASELVKADLNT